MDDREYGLPPLVGADPLVLILGSFPSKTSLAEARYYANPRNQFWALMRVLLGLAERRDLAWYEAALQDRGFALWDVIASRKYQAGSLDGAIRDPVLNDIPHFIRSHPTLRCIGLNGGKAGSCFSTVWRGENLPRVSILHLPSTSPANTRFAFDKKVGLWREILEHTG